MTRIQEVLELLDPADEDQLMLLVEARHAEMGDALRSGQESTVDGEPVNPRLHLAMHQIVANQLLADDPPETWQSVQRLAGLGYDWHNIMHVIARMISDDLYSALGESREFDPPTTPDGCPTCLATGRRRRPNRPEPETRLPWFAR